MINVMKSRRLRAGLATLSLATVLAGVVPAGSASAAAATKCTASQARVGKLRFNYERGTVQICDRVGNAYRWRKASPEEAREPYLGYLLPMRTTDYVLVDESVTSSLVVDLAGLIGNSRGGSIFAGFVALGLVSDNSLEDIDALMVVLPFTRAGRSAVDPDAILDDLDGEYVTIAGKDAKLSGDGDLATITYIGPTGMVLLTGDPANADNFVAAATDYLTANGGI
jgi:hypothetical protein